MNNFFLQTLTGLQISALYMLIALGLTLVFGTLGVVNFAHGALFMLGAYFAVEIASQFGFEVAIVAVPILLFIVGVALERGLIRHFYERSHTDQILVTFGLAIVIGEVLKTIYGANNIPFAKPTWGTGILRLDEYLPFLDGAVYYPKWRLILVVVSFSTVAALFILLQFTKFGLIVRAGMRDSQMIAFLGVNITRRFTIVFGIGSIIAAIAGIFGGPITQVEPELGMKLLIPSFLVVVVGGMGSLPGAVLASLIFGMAISFTAEYAPIQQIIIYLIAVVILLVRPRGLMGKKGLME
ncbi:MAG: branched-chain amino acid ABC transporter permease [Rhizobiales bacterium]|nr:branched-chain amino acid ABC transporter permease [Hyphomicrobiales bacterium]